MWQTSCICPWYLNINIILPAEYRWNVKITSATQSNVNFYSICKLRRRVKLEGKELEEYLEKEKLKKEAAKKLEQSKE